MYVNTTDSVETIVVVASDNNYRPGGNRYNLILSRSLSDIDVEKGAYAEASESVVYCEQEMSIVRDALSRLTLAAKDENGLTIGTIDNIALSWDINLSTGIATYEVNDADLPMGYTFGGKEQIKEAMCMLLRHVCHKEITEISKEAADIAPTMGVISIFEYGK